jgi:hypothetical protein
MNSEKLLSDLEDIVNKGLEGIKIPYAKGNSIRIGHIIVRTSPKGYLIYDVTDNRQVARVHFKTTAVAIAKNLAQGKNITEKLLEFDYLMLKHYNDAVYYKNSIKKSTDEFRKEVRQTRLDVAIEESRRVRRLLDKFIFS